MNEEYNVYLLKSGSKMICYVNKIQDHWCMKKIIPRRNYTKWFIFEYFVSVGVSFIYIFPDVLVIFLKNVQQQHKMWLNDVQKINFKIYLSF